METKDWATVSIGIVAAVLTASGLVFAWVQWRERRAVDRLARIKSMYDLVPVTTGARQRACQQIADGLLIKELQVPHDPGVRKKIATTVFMLCMTLFETAACAWLAYIFSTFPGDQPWTTGIRVGGYVFAFIIWLVLVRLFIGRIYSAWAQVADWPAGSDEDLASALDRNPEGVALRR